MSFCHRLRYPVPNLGSLLRLERGGPCSRFLEGLDDNIQDEIATHELPRELDSLVELALFIEGRVLRRRQHRPGHPSWRWGESPFPDATSVQSSPTPTDPEPMQLGHLRLTPQEKQDWLV